ncbi:MAG: DUF262 domain-containing protein [Pyrinomonadaceae bacterium]
MSKRTPTTKDVGLLRQLFEQDQLVLGPEFQRNSIWPPAAKAYLIDTILNDRPIPVLYFQRMTSAQTGRPSYAVIDGQQRIRAILEFLEDRFSLVESKNVHYKGKKFSALSPALKERILSYDLYIQEISGYSDADIRDMFVRMNKYVVKLAPQEIRHAQYEGQFANFVERIAKWDFWRSKRVFTKKQIDRMRAVEFVAELTILILEGPQDKKKAVDLYYERFKKHFPHGKTVEARLKSYLAWIPKTIPELTTSRFRKPVDFYSLIGALELASNQGSKLKSLNPTNAGKALSEFERAMRVKEPQGRAARYLAAASRQTDNIIPRNTRIEILDQFISGA